ncbi:MAG: Ig-like domain repeat protein, partial [Vicinamibacteria bacterium]|nr:Ig-like domain repeat protein [Vicinamibacteria bacterium]
AAQFISVLGHVQDATAVSVIVNGVTATVMSISPGVASFAAANVPVGPGPVATFTAVATDAASNTGQSAVTTTVDRTAPAVTIVKPAPGAYLKAGLVSVEVEVADQSVTMAEVNGVPALDPTCTGGSGALLICRFLVSVPLVGDGVIVATAVDAAGNIGHAQTSAILDSAPPNIVVTAPTPLLVTRAASIQISGVVTDASPFTLTVNGQTIATAADGAFSATLPAGPDGPRDLVFTATDAAGNEAVSTVSIIVDRTPPVLTIAAPAQGAVVPTLPLVVSGTVVDTTTVSVTVQGTEASVVGQAYTATLPALGDGSVTITVRASDAAGNETVLTRVVEVDLGPPTVAITSPATGALTRLALVTLAYTIVDRSLTSIKVNGTAVADCPGQSQPGAPACERSQSVILEEGDNTLTVEATDAGGRTSSAQVVITRDTAPPVVDLQAPETVSRGRVSSASVSATDNLALDKVELLLGSVVICTAVVQGPAGASSNCTGVIQIPESARPGDPLTVTARATDTAGNTTTTSRSVRVTADGVVTGTVLSDVTSLPISGASVTLVGANGRTVTTDAQGRYSIPVADTSAILHVEKAGMTGVDRVVSVVSGVGTVPLDARLTPLAEATTFSPVIPATNPPATIPAPGPAPSPLPSPDPSKVQGIPGPVSLAVPEGANRVTLLSPQGLPNLLPPGFSPLTAFHWTSDSAAGVGRVSIASSSANAVLVRYDVSMHDWRIVATGMVPTGGVITLDLVGPGSYALVDPDPSTPPLGAMGEALAGLSVLPIPAAATSESRVNPAILPPSGGTATGYLRLDSTSSLPSGTVVQADVDEIYTLASGEEASAPKRSMDVITYKQNPLVTAWTPGGITGASAPNACAPAAPVPAEGATPIESLCATFPITPSRTFATAGLREGRVHLDLMAGREYARGIVGGNDATSITSGNVRLNVAAGSLPEDTAMTLTAHESFSAFVPSTSALTPLAEVSVDFFGVTLNASASLTFANVAANAGDSLVLARVDRAAWDGIPRLQVVAMGDVWSPGGTDPATSVVTRVDSGLPGVSLEGITQSGRYVLFRVNGPLAFVKGITSASGSPVRALVTVTDPKPPLLPFVATSSGNGYYAIAVSPGAIELTAKVLGLSLAASAPATATQGAPVTVDIALLGTVTQATISPASGANNVEVNEPLTLTSPVAIDLASVSTDNIKLRTVPASAGGASVPVALRLVLSGSGKRLSIIPFVPETTPPTVPAPPALQFSTDYVLEVTGLKDIVGGLVTAPPTTFRTQAYTKKVYNLTAITFSIPNADGLVTVSAPNGTLDPGTTVLIINGGNGVVLGLTAGNDGQVLGTIPAGIDDIFFVTVTDPFGNATTFERGEFVDPATGETAVGAFGGTVRGPAGSALVIPEQALSKGTKFKLDFVTPDALEQRYPGQQPTFGLGDGGQPISHVGGALKVEVTAGEAKSSREMDLLFPIPSNLPAGVDPKAAFYYVYQRVEGPCPNGAPTCADDARPYFLRTLDHAFVECASDKPECDAADLRVRTASPPFNGFDGALALDVLGIFNPVAVSMNILVWTFNQILPGQPQAGVITGYVYQPVRERVAGVDKPVLKPVAGARVSGHDASGQAFANGSQVEAITGADGRYTLFDPRYVGGPFTLSAKYVARNPIPGQSPESTATATGFESDPEDAPAIELVPASLRQYRNRAILNLSFPAVDPPPPVPEIAITVCEETGAGCLPRNGLALVNRPLRIRVAVSVESGATVEAAEVNGAGVNVVTLVTSDTSKKVVELQPNAGEGTFTPSAPGSYVVRVRAITRENDPRVETFTFRVVGSTGAVDGLPNEAPGIITRKTLPQNLSTNVSVTNLNPEIYFTEPVRGLVAGSTITLTQETGEGAGPVEFDLIGVGVLNGSPVILNSVTPNSLVTSLTLKPRRGLKLDAKYVLALTSGVVDTDTPPKPVPPYTTSFTTFKPSVQGSEEGGFASPGIGVVGNLAFVVRNNFFNGSLYVWDIEDPASPKNLSLFPLGVAPRPIDVSADPAGDPMAAVSVVSTNASKPSSVIFASAQNPAEPTMTGAVTVASSAQDGFISRSAFHKGFVYLATTKKGIQVVDVARGQNIPDLLTSFQARVAINTDGRGFGQDAVVTIPYPSVSYPNTNIPMLVNMSDIEAADIQGQTLVASTGTLPLLLVDPQLGNPTAHWKPSEFEFTPAGASTPVHVLQGLAIGLGRVGAYDLAVLVALVDEADPASKVRLITVNVRDSAHPQFLGSLDLSPNGGPVDVTLRGTTAIVTTQKGYNEGEAIIVELVDPTNPYIKGRVAGVGGRAAINQDGQVVTTGISPFGGPDTPIGGVRSLVLESACTGLGRLETARVVQYRIFDPATGATAVEDARIRFDLCQRSQVTVMVNGQPMVTEVDSLTQRAVDDVDLAEGSHSILVPKDILPKVTDERDFTLTIKSVIDETERAIPGKIVGEIRNRPMLPVSRTFVKGVDLFDGHLAVGATDLQVKGRHFSLDVSRSYSSAGLGEGKSGWIWNYDGVIGRGKDTEKDTYTVVTADGSSQRFKKSATGNTFVPQDGYHTKLTTGGDGELIFIDKAANRHLFRAESSDSWVSGPWRLESIEEPHGDVLRIAYNKYRRVDTVKEYVKGADKPSTTLTFVYKPFRSGPVGAPVDPKDVALSEVFAEAASRSLNLRVLYEHFENGELRKVTRKGTNIGSGKAADDEVWEYRYAASSGRDANRLERIIDPDNHVTRYEFIVGPGFSPSEGEVGDRMEFVNKVIQSPGGGLPDVVTEYDFGPRSSNAASSTTEVKDPRGNVTKYTMNYHGGVTRIEEPLGRTTSIDWWPNDALKKREALPGGMVKDYVYDQNGNLTRETITGADGLVIETVDEYDLAFNKIKSHRDAEQRTTTWEIDGTTGDVKSMTNGVSDRTTYEYDPTTGLLKTEIDPRGVVTTYDQDTGLGMWKSRKSELLSPVPSAVTATRAIDGRGRITRETDGLGGEVVREYDGLDRPLLVRKVARVSASGASGAPETQDASGEVTRMTYTRGGQLKTTTNALGAVTTHSLDGMNRVIATSMPVTKGDPMTIATAAEYDGNGNVTKSTDPRNVARQFTYDALNRLTEVAILSGPAPGPVGVIASYTYKGATDLKETETDLSGNTTTFVYDGLFRLRERQTAEPG